AGERAGEDRERALRGQGGPEGRQPERYRGEDARAQRGDGGARAADVRRAAGRRRDGGRAGGRRGQRRRCRVRGGQGGRRAEAGLSPPSGEKRGQSPFPPWILERSSAFAEKGL